MPGPQVGGWPSPPDHDWHQRRSKFHSRSSLLGDEAEPIVELLEHTGLKPGRDWARAVGARCRGLILAAQGDVDGAATAFARAIEAHQRMPLLRHGRPDQLTPSEAHVATLAASGLTNREVATVLFVSAKTVEAHLARVYRKLAIHSRAELVRRMAEDKPSGDRVKV